MSEKASTFEKQGALDGQSDPIQDGKKTQPSSFPAAVNGNPNATPNAGTSGANSPRQSGTKR